MPYGDSEACNSCMVVARVLSDYLCDYEFLGWAVETVDSTLCQALPDSQADACEQLTAMLLPVAVDYLRASAPPSVMCSAAGICNETAVPLKTRALPVVRDDEVDCAMCRYLSRAMHGSSPSPQTEPDISAALERAERVCSSLPDELSHGCRHVLKKQGTLLAGLGGMRLSCDLVGACTSSSLSKVWSGVLPRQLVQAASRVMRAVSARTGFGDASTCDKCKMTVLEVRMLVNMPSVQSTIINATRALCDNFSPYEEQCRQAVDKYGGAAFTLFDKYVQPDTVCSTLHMCDPKPLPAAADALTGKLSRASRMGQVQR
eukprot:CAMPEP_0202893524 /NCGR_PEP_ID=MMETSP1392-20130828/3091_1 /ASSEMBLY_ACC=CAM_ASM_000868 /TAXON_ID=225041 /ORGANISM="Chlamydomonas chlamydogama, Strain SAG 11-48b" /LENGTH=316 /DNA_ID=CAMNT_0049577889 /DNA_START=189 /DNA_END=1139 /DNA_ORIENTATION=-